MEFYASTVVRNAPVDRAGEILRLDFETKRIKARVAIAPEAGLDGANPRGGTRGGRGTLIREGCIYVASYCSIHVFDTDLRLRRQITHPLFADLHEMCWDGADIWVTSTAVDALLKVDLHGNLLDEWWPREEPSLARRFNLQPADIDKTVDNRTRFLEQGNTGESHVHLNAVAMVKDRPWALLNRLGVVTRLAPTEIVIVDPALAGSHNLLPTACEHLLICNTRNRSLDVYRQDGGCVRRIDLTTFAEVRRIMNANWMTLAKLWLGRHGRPFRVFHALFGGGKVPRPVFVRGLRALDDGIVLVGISPAGCLVIDWHNARLLDIFSWSTNVADCVHGLALDGNTTAATETTTVTVATS